MEKIFKIISVGCKEMSRMHKLLLVILIYGLVLRPTLSFADDYCQNFVWNIDKDLNRLNSFFAWDGSTPLKLYSTSNFSLKPNFTLDREGFRSAKGLFCFWKAGKNSKSKPSMLLIPTCEEYLDMSTSVGAIWSYSEYDAERCKIIKLSHYVQSGGNIVAKVKYDGTEYFLNPSEYLGLLDPRKISLKEDREVYLEKSWNMFSGWSRSCFGAWEIKRPFAVESNPNAYLFFSLSGLFGMHFREVENEMRFFKGKDFSSEPDYVLDSKGLRKKDEVICSWKYPYSEKMLFKNYLDCEKEEQKLVQFFPRSEGQFSPPAYCAILVPKQVVRIDGFFTYKFQVGKDDYYLDTKDMPRVSNGYFFSTSEKREKESQKIEFKRQGIVKDNLGLLKKHGELLKIKDCIKSQRTECLNPYLGESLVDEVIRVAYPYEDAKKMCDIDKKSEECLKLVNERSLPLIMTALQFVEKEDLARIRFDENKDSKYFSIILNESLSTGLDLEIIKIEIDEKGLKLIDYISGLSC